MEETHTLNTCVCASACVCVGGRGTSYNQATWAPGLGGTRPLFPSPVCDTGWALSDDCLGLVIDLQLGRMLYVIFSLPHLPPPLSDPPTHLSLLPFQVTQSPHCTQGVVITGAAEIGQDKGTLPAQDVFPPFLLFYFFLSRTNHFPSPFLRPPSHFFFSSCHPIPYFSPISCTLFTHVTFTLARFPCRTSGTQSERFLFSVKKNKTTTSHS